MCLECVTNINFMQVKTNALHLSQVGSLDHVMAT